ncbi:AraC family transcriptional regulator [Bradyrhizobium sp. UFLA05-109]
MPISRELSAAVGRDVPQADCDSLERQSPARLLISSENRGWSGLSAELRSYGKGTIPWECPQSDIRICVDIHGSGSLVTRRASGIEDRTVTQRGTVWLSPAGWQDGSIDIADDLPEIVHIYLAPSQLLPTALGVDTGDLSASALRYETAFEDPLLGEIARAIASELHTETSSGKLMVESLANSMTARLLQHHNSTPATKSVPSPAKGGLDRRRLLRVMDYIETNLEHNLTLDSMASIACLSLQHFARAFRQATGQPPHRFVSVRRLERAKALLTSCERPIVDIALSLGFSSQANFTRAFRQATGQAPGQYRQAARSQLSQFSLTK